MAVLLPLFYVLGSGPTRPLAFRDRLAYKTRPGASGPALYITREQSAVWTIVYAPLSWASQEPWGKPIRSYWALFPIPKVIEKPWQ